MTELVMYTVAFGGLLCLLTGGLIGYIAGRIAGRHNSLTWQDFNRINAERRKC